MQITRAHRYRWYPVTMGSDSKTSLAARSVAANLVLVWAVTLIYQTHSYFLRFHSDDSRWFVLMIAVAYTTLSPALYLAHRHGEGVSHGLRVTRVVWRTLTTKRLGWDADERRSVMLSVVRAFFIPLMANATIGHAHQIGYRTALLANQQTADATLDTYYTVLAGMFLLDTAVFLLGYMIELPHLDNQVRSVDTSATGWLAALSCYSPFSAVTMLVIAWEPTYELHIAAGPLRNAVMGGVLVLTAMTLAAVLTLGLKASNLTHRGIVTRGPYAVVRHPIYGLKLLTWTLIAMPTFSLNALVGIAAWALIYAARAWTEERHLSKDPTYLEYAARVRWRFIPGLF